MSTTYVSMRVERSEGVAEVILLGPGKGNAMGPDFWTECPRVFTELDRDESVRAILVRGEGDHFTFGLDLKSMLSSLAPHFAGENLAGTRAKLLGLIGEMQQAFDRIEGCKKPVIAAIHGWCIGGGVDLISACDVRMASKDAKFSVREVKVAMVADLGSLQRLPRIVGRGHARELALTGKDIDAEHALRIGLVNQVLPTNDALYEAARAMAKEIAENPPLVVQGIKQVMGYCEDKSIADGERYVALWNAAFLASKDLMEALGAFSEKRRPAFKGE